MKLHQIRKKSEIYVAKLIDGVNMLNINSNIDKLKFKRIITQVDKTYFAEWCMDFNKTGRIDCINASPFDKLGNILVFSKNTKGEMFVAIVCSHNMDFYI
jgi:hypothetical protein